MQGEKVAAVGLSLGVHACVLTAVMLHPAVRQDDARVATASVSFAAPVIPLGRATLAPTQVVAAAAASALAPVIPTALEPSASPAGTELPQVAAARASNAPPSSVPQASSSPVQEVSQAGPSHEVQEDALTGARMAVAPPDPLSPRAEPIVIRPAASLAPTSSENDPSAALPSSDPSVQVSSVAESTPIAPTDAPALEARGPPVAALTALQPAADARTLPYPSTAVPAKGAEALTETAGHESSVPPVSAGPASVSSSPPRAILTAKADDQPATAPRVVDPVGAAALQAPTPPAPVETDMPQTVTEAGIQTAPDLLLDEARIQRMRDFIGHYDGGPCFFAAAGWISGRGAAVESFSAQPDKFASFDTAFKASTGLEAVVSGQRVWTTQCEAVDHLRQIPPGGGLAATLDLDRRNLKSGEALSGSVHGGAGRRLGLYVISEVGSVQDVSAHLGERGDTTPFSIPISHAASGGPFPQILVLVASRQGLPVQPTTIDGLFGPVLAEKPGDAVVAAKLFLVSR